MFALFAVMGVRWYSAIASEFSYDELLREFSFFFKSEFNF